MDAWRKALLTGNFMQQGSQAAAFIAAKRGKKRILVLTRNLAYLFQHFNAIILKCSEYSRRSSGLGFRSMRFLFSRLSVSPPVGWDESAI